MEDDWDLHAVVRGCATTTATSSISKTATVAADWNQKFCFFNPPFVSEQAGSLFSVADPFEARGDVEEELHELYKPFFPKSHSLNSPQTIPISSISSSLAVSIDQTQLDNYHHHHQQQLQKQQHKQSLVTIRNSNTAKSHTPRSKRRKNQQQRVCQVPAEGLTSDVWAWRKYGQKPIKGSPYPRGYYRCSSSKGCLARKQVERNRSDPLMYIITYTAEHNHPAPTHRNSLAGSTRQKPFTPQTVTAGNSTKQPTTTTTVTCSSSSPATSVEEELVHQSLKYESREDLLVEDDVEDDLGLSDMAVTDDFFEGLEGLAGTESGDCFFDHFPPNFGVPWGANNAATAAGGI